MHTSYLLVESIEVSLKTEKKNAHLAHLEKKLFNQTQEKIPLASCLFSRRHSQATAEFNNTW